MRHTFSLVMVALVVCICGWPAHTHAADQKRPNILFIFTDDHSTAAIGAYGSKINQTPNMDKLASRGMLFRHCYATNALCGPSRAVILTGKHSHLNGFMKNGDRFDGSQQTFPKLLQKAGYQTAVIGKWHLETDPTGFDYWDILPGQGHYYNPDFIDKNGKRRVEGYCTDVTVDLSLQWLNEQRDKDKPFMLMCQFKAPHRNWAPGPGHLTLYQGQNIPEPPTLLDDYKGRTRAAREQEMTLARHMFDGHDLKLPKRDTGDQRDWGNQELERMTPAQRRQWDEAYEQENEAFEKAGLTGDDLVRWRYQRYIKDYLRCIASVDDNIGRLMESLEKSGLADNTVVIYSSDQGFFLGEHGWYDKRFMYEESMKMPLIVHWPGVTQGGSESKHLVQNLDFAQTFLEMAGVQGPNDMQGRSLVPLLRGEQPHDWRKSIYYHYYEYPAVHMVHKHYGVRTERHKLIHFYDINEWELFDLEKDPDELTSAYGRPEYAQVTAELKRELKHLQDRYKLLPEDEARELNNARLMKPIVPTRVARFTPGQVEVPNNLDPAHKPLTILARCTPQKGEGVIVSQGGAGFGYSLYLRQGLLHWAIRNNGELVEAKSDKPIDLGREAAIAAVLDEKGQLALYLNGVRVAAAPGGLIAQKPADAISFGQDTGSLVGPYSADNRFEGALQDVQVYWGKLDEGAINRFASEP